MCRREQFSDKLTLFLATQAHAVEFFLWFLAENKSMLKYWQVELFHISFQVGDKARVMILFRK